VIGGEVIEMVPSDAVMVRDPFDLNAIEKVPDPLVRVADDGRTALESFELILTVPV
jgi:hypothetical protein